MQLNAYIVDWERVTRLSEQGKLEDFDDDEEGPAGEAAYEIDREEPPWPSDSCVQYDEVGEIFALVRGALPESTRSCADAIFSALFDGYSFPQDLGGREDPELIAGSLSPDTVVGLLRQFDGLDYEALDEAYDSVLTDADRSRFGSRDYFTDYLRQWEGLLRGAARQEAGVFVHLG